MNLKSYNKASLIFESLYISTVVDQPLNSFSCVLSPGDCLGISGPNGCGKTSLLLTVGGRLKPVSGRVFLEENPKAKSPRDLARNGVMLLPQHNLRAKDLTVSDLVVMVEAHTARMLIGRSFDSKAFENRLSELFPQLSITDRLDTLSFGECRAILLMLWLLASPKVLLLDEPFAGIQDQKASYLIEMWRLQASHMITILIDHDMNRLKTLATQTLIF